jgi:hypothetical protein
VSSLILVHCYCNYHHQISMSCVDVAVAAAVVAVAGNQH